MGLITFLSGIFGRNTNAANAEAVHALSRSEAEKMLGKLQSKEAELIRDFYGQTMTTVEHWRRTRAGGLRKFKQNTSIFGDSFNILRDSKSIERKMGTLNAIKERLGSLDQKTQKALLKIISKLEANYREQFPLVQKLIAASEELRQEAA